MTNRPMETVYVVLHKAKYGQRYYAVAAYRAEEDARNEASAITGHSGEDAVVDEVTLDGAVSADAMTGRDAYSPRRKHEQS